jgi:hypothetical protein
LEGKEFDFGDKIQYPYSYPLEFKGKASKFANKNPNQIDFAQAGSQYADNTVGPWNTPSDQF